MKFKKMSGLWSPQQVDDEITGKLLHIQEEGGKYESKVYTIETENAIFNVFGSTVLDDELKIINQIGNIIRIVFKGKVQGATAEYKSFEVYLGVEDEEVKDIPDY